MNKIKTKIYKMYTPTTALALFWATLVVCYIIGFTILSR